MKKALLMTTLALSMLAPAYSFASDGDKIDHYAGSKFESPMEAQKTLMETTQKVSEIVNSEDLDVAKMEQVHEISYTMEDAVAVLSKDSDFDFTALSEALEEVHLASEDHKAETMKASFETYAGEFEKFKVSAKTN